MSCASARSWQLTKDQAMGLTIIGYVVLMVGLMLTLRDSTARVGLSLFVGGAVLWMAVLFSVGVLGLEVDR